MGRGNRKRGTAVRERRLGEVRRGTNGLVVQVVRMGEIRRGTSGLVVQVVRMGRDGLVGRRLSRMVIRGKVIRGKVGMGGLRMRNRLSGLGRRVR